MKGPLSRYLIEHSIVTLDEVIIHAPFRPHQVFNILSALKSKGLISTDPHMLDSFEALLQSVRQTGNYPSKDKIAQKRLVLTELYSSRPALADASVKLSMRGLIAARR